MDYPKLNRAPAYTVSVPALSGGVNLSAGPNFVADNQLTACKNLYWKDGALRSRPGFQHLSSYSHMAWDQEQILYKGELEWEGTNMRCMAAIHASKAGEYMIYIALIRPDGSAILPLPFTIVTLKEAIENILVFSGPSTMEGGKGLYLLIALSDHNEIREYDGQAWLTVTEDDAYIPLVLINGKGNAYGETAGSLETEDAPSVMFEGFNTLFGRFRAGFVTDGKSSQFQLPASNLSDASVQIQFVAHSFNIPAGADESEPNEYYLDIFAHIDRANGVLTFYKMINEEKQEMALVAVKNVSNPLTVTASVKLDKADQDRLANPVYMSQAIWFGGSSLADGSRLFLTGNPYDPNIVRWSDFAKPLYFPENNYAYIGDTQPVTAMAKQGEMLLFFKPQEIYATTYVEGESYTADDILSGKVLDVTTVAATFPIRQLHPSIGCDRPGSIQLCDNRLVFSHSNGTIYTLVSSDSYSENNVYPLSQPIKGAVPSDPDIFSADWNGYYLLFQGDGQADGRIIVMDYRSYGFRNIASYARNKTDVPFFIWENPLSGCVGAAADENSLCLLQVGEDTAHPTYLRAFLLQGDMDKPDASVEAPIASAFSTKLFDFDQPHRQKRISAVHLGAGGGGEMSLRFLTQRGETGLVRRRGLHNGKQPGQAGYISTLSVHAPAARVQQFGVGVEALGLAAFDGLTLQYTILR